MPRHKRVVVQRGPAFVPCGQCSDGWVTRVVWERNRPRLEVMRCQCWTAHQKRLSSASTGDGFDARAAQVGGE